MFLRKDQKGCRVSASFGTEERTGIAILETHMGIKLVFSSQIYPSTVIF